MNDGGVDAQREREVGVERADEKFLVKDPNQDGHHQREDAHAKDAVDEHEAVALDEDAGKGQLAESVGELKIERGAGFF